MKRYVIECDLGPTYWLRPLREDEDTAGQHIIELSDAEWADYERVQELQAVWEGRLRKAYKG